VKRVVDGGDVIRSMRKQISEESGGKDGVDARTRRFSQSGTSVVEAAIVLPIILLVVLGTVEIGMAFRDFLTVGAVSRDGARIAALSARSDESDCAVLKGIAALATQGDIERIESVQIYKAAEGSGTQGATNVWTYKTGFDPAECNTPANPAIDGWSQGASAYPPSSRNTTIYPAPPPYLDLIGVRVRMRHDWITGFPPFRGNFTIDESTITRVEPEAFG